MRALAVVVAFAVAGTACSPNPPEALPPCTADSLISLGQKIPDCSFEGIGGRPDVRLSAYAGRPLVLNFWASWCAACIKEMPDIDAVATELEGRVAFVGMNMLSVQGETRVAAERFADRTGVAYDLAFDEEGRLYAHFGNVLRPLLPTTVFVDAEQRVARYKFGEFASAAEVRAAVEDAFGVR
ncbi:MAG TPA: TlpA disulfide reductase family protein [Actinomycetota bacterium]